MSMPPEYSMLYGAPQTIWLSLNISHLQPTVDFNLMLYNKVCSAPYLPTCYSCVILRVDPPVPYAECRHDSRRPPLAFQKLFGSSSTLPLRPVRLLALPVLHPTCHWLAASDTGCRRLRMPYLGPPLRPALAWTGAWTNWAAGLTRWMWWSTAPGTFIPCGVVFDARTQPRT